MGNTLIEIFKVFALIIGISLGITSILSKIILHRNGIKVNYLFSSIKDIREMKKLVIKYGKYKLLYYGLLFFSFAFLILFILLISIIILS